MRKDRILAVDIGTSSVRAMVFDPRGTVHARAKREYGTVRPLPSYEEQDPVTVRDETFKAMRSCLCQEGSGAADIGGISFSSQMYGVFPVDEQENPMTASMIWCDSRARKQAERTAEGDAAKSLYRSTGCRPDAMFPLYKVMWLREQEPEIFRKARRFVSIKEFVISQFLYDWVVDYSMASSTGMLNIHQKQWDEQALETAGISPERLSQPLEGSIGFPVKNRKMLESLGLGDDVLLFCGGGDGPMANIGSGASSVGEVNIDLGTSGAARVVVDRPAVDDQGILWCFCMDKDCWTSGGILTNAGNTYQWLGESIASFAGGFPPDDILQRLDQYAQEVPAGSDGLFFLPYLRKVRSPHWNSRLTGTVYGLTPDHDLRHMARAVLEATAYDIAAILDLAAQQVPLTSRVILTGGLSRSLLTAQIIADVLQKEVVIPENSEGSISGAAMLGLKSMGCIKEYGFLSEEASASRSCVPRENTRDIYEALRGRYGYLISKFSEIEEFQLPAAHKEVLR